MKETKTTELNQDDIVKQELEARCTMLAQLLKINGFEVTVENNSLKIKGSNGFSKEAHFNQVRMHETILKGGTAAIDRLVSVSDTPPSDSKVKKAYLEAGVKALQIDRQDFTQAYFRSIQRELKEKIAEREKVLEKNTKETPEIIPSL